MDLTFCKYRSGYICLKQDSRWICCTTTIDWKKCDFYNLNTEEGRNKFADEQPNESKVSVRGI